MIRDIRSEARHFYAIEYLGLAVGFGMAGSCLKLLSSEAGAFYSEKIAYGLGTTFCWQDFKKSGIPNGTTQLSQNMSVMCVVDVLDVKRALVSFK